MFKHESFWSGSTTLSNKFSWSKASLTASFMKIHNVLLTHQHIGVKTLCLWQRCKWKNWADRNWLQVDTGQSVFNIFNSFQIILKSLRIYWTSASLSVFKGLLKSQTQYKNSYYTLMLFFLVEYKQPSRYCCARSYLRMVARVSVIVLHRFNRASSLCGSSFRNLTASTSTRSTTRILLCRPGNWSLGESNRLIQGANCDHTRNIYYICPKCFVVGNHNLFQFR